MRLLTAGRRRTRAPCRSAGLGCFLAGRLPVYGEGVCRPQLYDRLRLAVIARRWIFPDRILDFPVGGFEVQTSGLASSTLGVAWCCHADVAALGVTVDEDQSPDSRVVLGQRCLKTKPGRPPVPGSAQIQLKKFSGRILNDFVDQPGDCFVPAEVLLL